MKFNGQASALLSIGSVPSMLFRITFQSHHNDPPVRVSPLQDQVIRLCCLPSMSPVLTFGATRSNIYNPRVYNIYHENSHNATNTIASNNDSSENNDSTNVGVCTGEDQH